MVRDNIKIISNKNILIGSLQHWHSPMISKHFIALELAKLQNNVTFLNIERAITGLFHNRHIKKKFNQIQHKRVKVKTFYTPPGFLRIRTLYQLALNAMHKTIGADYYPDVIFSFDPQFCFLHELFPKALRIYYCVDHVASNRILEKAQNRILLNSDIVIVASKRLYKDFQAKHLNVNYLPHGVNLLEEYESIEWKNRIQHWFQDKKNRPVFGFLGCLGFQIDFPLIDFIARQNPKAMIALIGPQSHEIKKNIKQLPDNVFCPGPVPSIAVKYCLSNFDLGIVPYRNNQFNSRRNPIKIMQYLASGLPVVSTVIGEDFSESKFVYQCKTPHEFNENLIKAYENNRDLILQTARLKTENSWTTKIKRLDEILYGYRNGNGSSSF